MQKSNKIAMLVIAVLVTVLLVYYSRISPPGGGRQLVPAPRVSQAEETKATATDSTADTASKPASQPASDSASASAPAAATPVTAPTPTSPAVDDEILARIRALNTTGDAPVSPPATASSSAPSTDTAATGNAATSTPTPATGTTLLESKPDSAVPAPAVSTPTPTATTPAAPTTKTYAIQAGDTFSSIAEKFLGSEKHWPLIAQENPRVDPAKLKIGQIIRIPESAEPPPAVEVHDDSATPHADSAGNITYTVKADDTLSSIAKQYYGSSAKWEVIHQANLSVIGDDPGRLKLGMKLIIPGPTQEAR